MVMTLQLPEEVETFIRAEVAQGAAVDEAEFLAKAVEMYRELKASHEDLRARVNESIAQYERGEVRPLDTQASQAEARRRFSQNR
jgi:Arc/MetJ-type ribon-helix-helix transcriptional regulator